MESLNLEIKTPLHQLDWVNEEIKSLGDEQFFHKDYEETLVDTYGKDYEEDLVVEGGAVQ